MLFLKSHCSGFSFSPLILSKLVRLVVLIGEIFLLYTSTSQHNLYYTLAVWDFPWGVMYYMHSAVEFFLGLLLFLPGCNMWRHKHFQTLLCRDGALGVSRNLPRSLLSRRYFKPNTDPCRSPRIKQVEVLTQTLTTCTIRCPITPLLYPESSRFRCESFYCFVFQHSGW